MKKHRKLLTLGVVICLVAGLVAGIVYYKQVEEERKLSLIYIPKVVDGTNDFWTSLIQGAEMAAKEYNADIRVWAPEEENDVAGQNKLIERAIEEKPDAILISPSSFTESDQLLKKAKEQGIHIAFIDSYTQEEVQDLTVATDNLEAGQILGFMGDTGYGEEGMSGKFPVHLHLGFYINPQGKEELSVNPYYVLQAMEK